MSKAARKKEEERIEKVIRNLLKLPENRRCINCTSLGPQYVCTTFWTYVCTNCSGVHREFTHRVKSVSMAKFSEEEISSLQAGGNERAREIYFKAWDPQRHIVPDGSNQNRLRDFIRQVYEDRKYTEESTTKLAVTKTVTLEETLGRRSVDKGSSVDERRSPRYRQDTVKSKSRPGRLQIVDDRFRDDDSVRGRRSNANRVENAEKIREKTGLPEVRSVKEFLGEDIPALLVGTSPEDDNDAKTEKKTCPRKEVSSPRTKEHNDVKPPEVTREKTISLIDLMDDPEPSDPQAQEKDPSTVDVNEGLVKSSSTRNVSTVSQVNSLELMLFDLSDPASEAVPINVDIPNDGSQIATFGDTISTVQHINTPAGASCEQAPSTQSSTVASAVEPFQHGFNVASDNASQTGPQASSMEAKFSGRGELPMEFFSGSYPQFQAPVQNWQYHPAQGMGYNMYQHYPPNSMPAPTFPNVARSANPFDLNDTVTQAQTPMYPSMLPVQDGASNLPGHHCSSHTNSYQLMQPQAIPYQNMSPSQAPTYGMSPVPGSATVSGAFSGQQLLYGMPLPGSQGDMGVVAGQQNDPFASLSPIQHRTHGGNNVPSTANTFPPEGGNPFG